MKKTMKLALLVCLALLACALMFTACDSGNEPQTPSNTTDGTTDSHVHTFGEWITVKESTTTEKGLAQRYCAECNYTESKPLDLHVHSFGEWTIAKEPSCDMEGTQTRACVCGETEEQTVAPQHKMVAEAYDIAPSCTSAGQRATEKCTECDYRNIEYFGKPIGHTFNEEYFCSQCQNKIFAIGCQYCLLWSYEEAGDYSGDHMNNSQVYDIRLTKQVSTIRDGVQVYIDITSVHRKYFYNSPVQSITLLENITKICESAFENCGELTFVSLTTSVDTLENNAFKNCPNLKYIVYSGTMEQWNAIEKGTDWDVGTDNYTVYCSDGTITK